MGKITDGCVVENLITSFCSPLLGTCLFTKQYVLISYIIRLNEIVIGFQNPFCRFQLFPVETENRRPSSICYNFIIQVISVNNKNVITIIRENRHVTRQ